MARRASKRIPRAIRIDRLLDAAAKRVALDGLDGLRVTSLADDLGFTAAALYRYFDSKDAILAALLLREMERVRVRYSAVLERLRGKTFQTTPSDSARALVPLLTAARLHHDLSVRSPAAFGLLSVSLADPRQLMAQSRANPVWQETLGLVEEVAVHCEEAARAGAIGPGSARDRAMVLVFGEQGVLQLGKMAQWLPDLVDTAALGAELSAALLIGWGARNDHLEEARIALDAAIEAGLFKPDTSAAETSTSDG